MKHSHKILAATFVAMIALKALPMAFGACYGVPPICITGFPVCWCDQLNNCHWACK